MKELFLQVEDYMEQLDNNRIPRVGTEGEKYRDIQLVVQLPRQDLTENWCRHLKTPAQKRAFEEFRHARDHSALDIANVLTINEEMVSARFCCCWFLLVVYSIDGKMDGWVGVWVRWKEG